MSEAQGSRTSLGVSEAPGLAEVVAMALAEDLGGSAHSGIDVTAAATVPAGAAARANVVARWPGVVAGLTAAASTFVTVDPSVRTMALATDGDEVEAGEAVLRVEGPARSVLTAERTALNLLCHLSGVATLTARYVEQVAGTGTVVRDTRKTLPGLRALQKAAVVAGGGMNHRMSLADGLLVKDNHVAVAGGVAAATRLAVAAALAADPPLTVQVEVDSLAELDQALEAGAPSVLLDNFTLDDVRIAVARCQEHSVFVEASGGVTLGALRALAEAGVDAVAIGALTHSAPTLDFGLDFEPV